MQEEKGIPVLTLRMRRTGTQCQWRRLWEYTCGWNEGGCRPVGWGGVWIPGFKHKLMGSSYQEEGKEEASCPSFGQQIVCEVGIQGGGTDWISHTLRKIRTPHPSSSCVTFWELSCFSSWEVWFPRHEDKYHVYVCMLQKKLWAQLSPDSSLAPKLGATGSSTSYFT